MGLNCFHCHLIIGADQSKFMLALEKPYMNLWFHRPCYDSVRGEIELYLAERYLDVLKYEEKFKEIKKKRHNGEKSITT